MVEIIDVPGDWTVWAFSDPHGVLSGLRLALFEAGLVDTEGHWSAPPQTALVGCGDYIDRGTDSLGLVMLLRRLEREAKAAGGMVALARGNHEQMMLDGMAGDRLTLEVWLGTGGRSTLQSMRIGAYGSHFDPATVRRAVADRCPWLEEWLAALAPAVRWRDVLLVHGGLAPGFAPEMLGRSTDAHLWVRGEFFRDGSALSPGHPLYRCYYEAGIRRVVFGHTPHNGVRLFHDGDSLCLDTNACSITGPGRSGASIVLARLPEFDDLGKSEFVVVPTANAPEAVDAF